VLFNAASLMKIPLRRVLACLPYVLPFAQIALLQLIALSEVVVHALVMYANIPTALLVTLILPANGTNTQTNAVLTTAFTPTNPAAPVIIAALGILLLLVPLQVQIVKKDAVASLKALAQQLTLLANGMELVAK
jgi:hypothetical protein